MPNHVINELVFRDLTSEKKAELLSNLCVADQVDFQLLLPVPLNVWQFSCGTRHEKAFQTTGLDWCRLNWGTKWNAYSQQPIEQTDDSLILRFETAWRPPYGWLCAILNRFKIAFEHNWLDEGAERGVAGRFQWVDNVMRAEPWAEEPADDTLHRHLHKLHWGVEEFPPEPDEDAA